MRRTINSLAVERVLRYSNINRLEAPRQIGFAVDGPTTLHPHHGGVQWLPQPFDHTTTMDRATHTFNEALAALNRRDLRQAQEKFRQVLALNGAHVPALNLLTITLMGLRRFAEAEPFIAKAVALNRTSDVSFYNYGLISKELGKPRQAYEQFSAAIKLNPDVAETWNNRGTVCNDLKDYGAALADFDRAIGLNAAYAEAYTNKGKSLALLKRNDEALTCYDKALSLNPALAEAWLGRGNVSAALRRSRDALAAYDKALSIKPGLVQAWIARGNLLIDLKRFDDALAGFDQAIALDPKLAEAWSGRGDALTVMKRFDDAFTAFDRAFSLDPDMASVEGARLHAKMHCCDWSDYDAECAHLVGSVRAGKRAALPFHMLSVDCSPQDQLQCARAFAAERYPPATSPASPVRRRSGRIRIAYLSSDFRQHATSHLIAGLFEAHDREKFDVIGISVGPDDRSPLRSRLERAFTCFVDLSALTDDQIASEIAARDVDILVDLNGFTLGAQTGALRHRPAPIQVNYLGYPGTMGAPFIDYVIADGTVIPEADRSFYSEKVVWLPHSYQVNDRAREMADRVLRREDFGLPPDAFVFCCFNNAYKITPETFDCWMRLLARTDSVLWLLRDNDIAAGNLRNEARQRGIDPARLVFAERVSPAEHLARHRLADLFLDTLPYNAHTTASDALWAGLPVLTQMGRTFAGRVAASLLHAIDLPELITHSREDYEALALELAGDRERLRDIKSRLEANRLTTPLFDTALFARDIEAAYEKMLAP
jgi:predicted O-linked N-acetylglucosamine transferase (SPINDLY family)